MCFPASALVRVVWSLPEPHDAVVPSLSLLEERVTRLHGLLQRQQQQLLASPGPGPGDSKVLDDLYEDIHWLILVTGWLVLSFETVTAS